MAKATAKQLWDDILSRYPEERTLMDEEQHRSFVRECFDAYEMEGFAKEFSTPYTDKKRYEHSPFKVVGRVSEKEADLECLPMWAIEFPDGCMVNAFPEEVIPSEQARNGLI